MSYRHPMPPSNARKILTMLREGSLRLHGGYRDATLESDGTFTVAARNAHVTVDYLIDASGTPADVSEINSPLLNNLLHSRIVARCEFGGIECDPVTHRIRPLSNLYVIGQLSRGRVFYVSALERLSVHAMIIAADLTHSLVVNTEVRSDEVAA